MKRIRTRVRAGTEQSTKQPRLSVRGVRRRAWLIGLTMVVAGAAAAVIATTHDSVYRAEALILVRPVAGDSGSASSNERLVDTEIQVIQSAAVEHQAQLDLAVVSDLPDVDAFARGASDAVALRVEAGNPRLAASLANAYANAYITVSRQQATDALRVSADQVRTQLEGIQQRIDAIDAEVAAAPDDERDAVRSATAAERTSLLEQRTSTQDRLGQLETDASAQTGGARVVSAAVAVDTPVEPRPLRTGLLGMALGLLLGLALAVVADLLDTSVHTRDDVSGAADTPVLATIPPLHGPDRRPVAFTRGNDAAAEAYRTLRTELQLATRHRPYRVLQVTGPVEGVGTTTTAVNLAVYIALTGRRVALVDGNLRSPRLHEVFSTASKGLTAAMLGHAVIDSLHPVALATGHLEVLPVGFVPTNPSETLGSPRMKAVLDEVASMFDMVVIDSSGVLESSDAVVLSGIADAVIVVSEAHRTTAAELHDTMTTLDRAGAPVVGAVLNRGSVAR